MQVFGHFNVKDDETANEDQSRPEPSIEITEKMHESLIENMLSSEQLPQDEDGQSYRRFYNALTSNFTRSALHWA